MRNGLIALSAGALVMTGMMAVAIAQPGQDNKQPQTSPGDPEMKQPPAPAGDRDMRQQGERTRDGVGMRDGERGIDTDRINNKPPRAEVDQMISGWHPKSKEAAKMMMDKYGAPDEVTMTHLHWHQHGQWKWARLSSKPVEHNWPSPHVDLLEQAIDYKVPPDMADDLATFDGSVVIERTKGELIARCQEEYANFLAINLANDIVTRKRNVEEARREYEKQSAAHAKKESAPFTEKLTFAPATGGTADPDAEAKMMDAGKPAPTLEKKIPDKN